MKQCKIEDCNNPVWGDGLCKYHKPRKKIPSGKKMRSVALTSDLPPEDVRLAQWVVMRTFFMGIWNIRPHVSEISKTHLGHEPLSVFFHHILPKVKYPQLRYDDENIILLTLDEHSNVEANMYKYEEINIRRESLLIKHGLQDPSNN